MPKISVGQTATYNNPSIHPNFTGKPCNIIHVYENDENDIYSAVAVKFENGIVMFAWNSELIFN